MKYGKDFTVSQIGTHTQRSSRKRNMLVHGKRRKASIVVDKELWSKWRLSGFDLESAIREYMIVHRIEREDILVFTKK